MESQIKIHDHEQRTPEWFACRRGKLTGSNALTIATAGKGLETYCYEVLAEKYADIQEESFTNAAMERGIKLEPDARTLFEFQTSKSVKEVGFIEYNEFIGASPDGLIEKENNAVVEIKCHDNKNFFMLMVHGVSAIKKDYLYQIQMEMLCAQADVGYYVAYNPNFKDALLIFKIEKSEKIQESIILGCQEGIRIMQEIESKLPSFASSKK